MARKKKKTRRALGGGARREAKRILHRCVLGSLCACVGTLAVTNKRREKQPLRGKAFRAQKVVEREEEKEGKNKNGEKRREKAETETANETKRENERQLTQREREKKKRNERETEAVMRAVAYHPHFPLEYKRVYGRSLCFTPLLPYFSMRARSAKGLQESEEKKRTKLDGEEKKRGNLQVRRQRRRRERRGEDRALRAKGSRAVFPSHVILFCSVLPSLRTLGQPNLSKTDRRTHSFQAKKKTKGDKERCEEG